VLRGCAPSAAETQGGLVKITGSQTIRAHRDRVWQELTDPHAIAGCLPGVQNIEKVGEDEYAMAMNLAIGPVKGTFSGKIRLMDVHEPDDYRMQVEGSGGPGFVKGDGVVRLSEDGETTRVDYEGDVEVGGPVGAVAQRMLGGVANRMVGQFFTCIEGQISGS
jgi:carbon monoxide dehydrogenase subunit G